MTRTHVLAFALALLLAPAVARAQADSARADSARADSAGVDSLRAAKPAKKPAAPAPAPPLSRTLAAGECPSPAERNDADALRRFQTATARGPVALAKPLLRDPTLRGRTTLAFEVDTLGHADSATVRIVDGDPYLLPTARSSAARWRYRPAELLPGCRVRARATETVVF